MSIETLTTFFGWLSVVNITILVATGLTVMFARGWHVALQVRMFGIEPEKMKALNLQYLSFLKVAVIVTSIAPYIALRLMG